MLHDGTKIKININKKFVESYHEKFVNNPDSKDINNTTDKKNTTIYKMILIKLILFPLSVLFAFNNYYPLIFLIYDLHDYNGKNDNRAI